MAKVTNSVKPFPKKQDDVPYTLSSYNLHPLSIGPLAGNAVGFVTDEQGHAGIFMDRKTAVAVGVALIQAASKEP